MKQKIISVNKYYEKEFGGCKHLEGIYSHQMELAINHLIENGFKIIQIIQTNTFSTNNNFANYSALIEK